MNSEELTKKRFEELSDRAYFNGYATYTEFLNLNEISILKSLRLQIAFRLFGGWDGAERCVCAFGENADFPISCIKIEPVNMKYSDRLTHRDFLGTITGTGIDRNNTGDIILRDGCAYVFCLDRVCDYICENVTRVRHTTVKCTRLAELPDFINEKPEPSEVLVPSLRCDAVISSVFKLSRNETARLFESGKVFINAAEVQKESKPLNDGDVVSVRGCGRFIFDGCLRETKKGRNVIEIRKY